MLTTTGYAEWNTYELENDSKSISQRNKNISWVTINPAHNYSMIEEVNFSKNNLLFFNIQHFDKLPQLQKLNVAYNKMRGTFDLEVFTKFTNLVEFSASHNQITDLENSQNDSKSGITTLNFANNDLIYFSVDIFSGFKLLSTLYLHNNNIFLIDNLDSLEHFLPKLSELTIHRNNWLCNETLDSVIVAMEELNITRNHFETRCLSGEAMVLERTCCFPSLHQLESYLPEVTFERMENVMNILERKYKGNVLYDEDYNYEPFACVGCNYGFAAQIRPHKSEKRQIIFKGRARRPK